VTLQTGGETWRDITRVDNADAGRVGDRKFVTALARGLEELRAFTLSDGLLGNGEIAERTGLLKPTVTRLTYTLTRLGHLAYFGRLEKYQLALSTLAISHATLANMRIRQVARPCMQGIAGAIKDYETRGFTMSIGDWERDVSGVSVPLIPSDGSSIFVFNCNVPAFPVTREKLERDLGPRLVNMVRNIQVDLNGR